MVYSTSENILMPGNFNGKLARFRDEGLLFVPGLVACEYAGTAVITSTSATSWQILDRNGEQPVIPIGAKVYYIGLSVPTGITATSTDLLKVAPAVNTSLAMSDSATAGVLSAAAASSTFAAAITRGVAAIDSPTANASTAKTLTLYSVATGGGTTAGSGMTAANAKVRVILRYTMVTDGGLNDPANDYRFTNVTSTKVGDTSDYSVGYP